ncbi:hypothetical protein GCM10012275_27240 [Longimycelium tulufanense]|uniref:DUF4192 domain-containing protein n=2 Tax=Longimycelium tulufanense TaxID=907463 RepID=A0A8J3CFW1_9PSEU|nr:hypothetical protein GCM10012275_27240 [Longimycelium tulufanense]
MCLRVDLPPPEHHQDLAEQLLKPTLTCRANAAMLLVVGGGSADPPVDLPYRDLVAIVGREFATAGLPVIHSLWVASIRKGAHWCCYSEPDCAGVLPDPRSSAAAAATAAAGWVTFANRKELADQLAPDEDEVLAHRAALLSEALETTEQDRALAGGAAARRDLAVVHRALRSMTEHGPPLDDEEIVRLGLALSDFRVRDVCLGLTAGEHALAAERLWTTLVRALPAPERAEPAILLAFTAYLRGDGALATVALSVADEARPGHHLARLMIRALQAGITPARMATLAQDAAAEARIRIEEEPTW